jgi:hypothetical protein
MGSFCSTKNYILIVTVVITLCPSCQVDAIFLTKRTNLKDVQLVPNVPFRIAAMSRMPLLGQCLLEGFKNEDCETVVHEGNSCSLYNRSNGIHSRRAEEKVVAVTLVVTE